MESHNVRRNLAALRQRWANHSPEAPLCLSDELEVGLPIATFCLEILLLQRARRRLPPGHDD